MRKKIETLHQFYDLMTGIRAAREVIVARLLEDPLAAYGSGSTVAARAAEPLSGAITVLRGALAALQAIPRQNGRYRLTHAGEEGRELTVSLDLSYEIGELEKDLFYLSHAEGDFLAWLAERHPGFDEQVRQGIDFLEPLGPVRFFSDRDGTVNNYCGRYRSSIQPAWNGLFLSRFALGRAGGAVILTSAPLLSGGLLEVSVAPRELFVHAGSKGREFLDREGRIHVIPIPPEKQEALERLNGRLTRLLTRPEHEIFTLIGSGLQFKFGQTTIACQDIHHSISEEETQRFRQRVRDLVRETDPGGDYFRIEDTGLDLEIILTVEGPGAAREFGKGDGIAFIDRELSLGLKHGPNLICGDTRSDLAMLRAALERTWHTWTIFVTRDPELRREVAALSPQSFFVSEPDALVTILNHLGVRELS